MMRRLLIRIVRRTRPLAYAALRRLPVQRRASLLTLAHYAKLVMLQGYSEAWAREAAAAMDSATAMRPEAPAQPERSVLPGWVIGEMRELARIEPDLYPTEEFVARFSEWSVPIANAPGDIFARLAARGARRYDVVLLCPYLRPGGADKGILQYLGHYRSRGVSVLLVTTTEEPSPWLPRVPQGVAVLEAGEALAELLPDDRRLVLARLLLQWRPQVLHLVQSDLGWRTVQHHGPAFRTAGTRIVASLFCDDYDRLGRPWSYARAYLLHTARHLDRIVCDSTAYCEELRARFGLAPELTHAVHFHVPPPALPSPVAPACADGPAFLWAGRLCRQKRPDLLVAVAKARPDVRFRVFGSAEDDAGREAASALARLSNVELLGAFDGLPQAAATACHAGLLYTTQWDGLPNVLLEAASIGLPVVAGMVGGIGDLIDESTGYPVRTPLEADAYVEQIDRLLADPLEARARAQRAAERIRDAHGEAVFASSMDEAMPWLRARVTLPAVTARAQ